MSETYEERGTCLGAVLAGGRSRRMGAPKEGVRLWDGRPMIEHVLAPLHAVCGRAVIVGGCRGYQAPPDVPCLADEHPGSGPLAGIHALVQSGLARGYLVVACDQPFVTPDVLSRLLSGDPDEVRIFRLADGSFHPFPGYYPTTWLPRAEDALRRGELSMRAFIGPERAAWPLLSQEESECLRNLNRPEEVQAYLAASER